MVKLRATPIDVNIVQIYAPTSMAAQKEIDRFYGSLNETMRKIPKRELVLIIGDFNAKVGDTTADNSLREVIGKYGLGTRNERGELLIEFCADNNLYIANIIRTSSTTQDACIHGTRQMEGRAIRSTMCSSEKGGELRLGTSRHIQASIAGATITR